MVDLCLLSGLGKRKRVMDEKELMMPLELGYVLEAEKRKALIKKFTSEHVVSLSLPSSYRHMVTNVQRTLLFWTTLPLFCSWNPRWRRETRIKPVAGRPQGEVAYYAPCGKKLRQYPDVMKVPRPHGAVVQSASMIQKQLLWGIQMSSWVCNRDYMESL